MESTLLQLIFLFQDLLGHLRESVGQCISKVHGVIRMSELYLELQSIVILSLSLFGRLLFQILRTIQLLLNQIHVPFVFILITISSSR